MKKPIYGQELMVFINEGTTSAPSYKSIAHATNHTATFTGNVQELSSKDFGVYAAQTVTGINWEITADHLYTKDAFVNLFDLMEKREPVMLAWAPYSETSKRESGINNETETWTPDSTASDYFTGEAVISNLSENAQNGDVATFSITFTGNGAMKRVNATGGGN